MYGYVIAGKMPRMGTLDVIILAYSGTIIKAYERQVVRDEEDRDRLFSPLLEFEREIRKRYQI